MQQEKKQKEQSERGGGGQGNQGSAGLIDWAGDTGALSESGAARRRAAWCCAAASCDGPRDNNWLFSFSSGAPRFPFTQLALLKCRFYPYSRSPLLAIRTNFVGIPSARSFPG